MNKQAKGDFNYAGMIVIAAIALIIGTSLFASNIGNDIGRMTNTFTITNQSVTTAANGAYVDLTGQELVGDYAVNNGTPYVTNGAIGVTIEESVSTVTGTKRVRMKTNNATWASKPINVTYTYGSEGYADSAGSRAIAALIAVFFALLIMVVALTPVLRSGLLELVGYK